MAVDIGPKIGIEGEREFQNQLKNVNQAVKTLGSEMKLVTAEFTNNAKSEEALTKKNDVLERTISTLNDKLELQQKALKASADEYGEADAKTMRLQQAVNETKAAMAKAQAQVEQNTKAMDELTDATDDAGDEFDDAGKQAASFGDVLRANVIGDVIMKGVEALANGIKKAGQALKDVVVDSAAYADDMLTLADKTGLSTDELQEFKYMANLVDTELSTITGSLTKLTTNMNTAKKGTGTAADAFKKLGVQITNSDGTLRDNQDVFMEVIGALGEISNETERDAMAMQLFGKSAQDLNPLINAGADTIAAYAEEAHKMGYVLDGETLQSLGNVQTSFDKLHLLTDSIKNQLGTALAPIVEDLTGKFTAWAQSVDWDAVGQKIKNVADGIKTFFEFVSENGDTIVTVLAAIAAGFVAFEVTGLIMSLVEAIKAFQLANEGASIAQAALNVVMSANPIGIVIAALSALVAAVVVLWNTNEDFRNWCINAWNDIINWINNAVNDVVEWVSTAWENIKNFFINAPQFFKDLGRNIIEGIWNGIKNMTQWLINKITGFFGDVVSSVKRFLGIASPSKVFATIGEQMAAGLAVGWDKEFKDVAGDINGSMSSLLPESSANAGVVSAMRGTGVTSAMADGVNALGSLLGFNGNGDLNIQFNVNGREFYRATLADFRLVQSQNPVILNDF